MAQFQPGDIVMLKSGGPPMTISKIDNFNGQPSAICHWFEGTKAAEHMFSLTILEKC